jgi:hypothetical protein
MRHPREPLTLKRLMGIIALLALVLTVLVQSVQLRRGEIQQEQLRASLAAAAAKAAWFGSIDEWNRLGDSPSLKKQWSDGIRRAKVPTDRR